MARIGFCLASVASLAFVVWFLVKEMESPGLSFAVALIGMPLLITLFGLFNVKGDALTKDARTAGWAAAVIALLAGAYIAAFFGSWIIVAALWLALHVPMIIALVSSPTTGDS